MSDRAAKVAQAQRLRAEGLLLREIAERMGCAIQTAHSYISDPDLAKLKARKDGYRGRCDQCGAETDGSNGRAKAPTRCRDCITWTAGAVECAFAEWADSHGGVPPREADARVNDALPHYGTVARLFGSWNRALLACGFELWCDRRAETQEEIEDALRAGEAVVDVADRFGVTPAAIYQRLRVRGICMDDLRSAA